MGKRLADDQSSFHNTAQTGGGTFGYRAPECLLAIEESYGKRDIYDGKWVEVVPTPQFGTRITRAIDIFSSGCTFYFAMTSGEVILPLIEASFRR